MYHVSIKVCMYVPVVVHLELDVPDSVVYILTFIYISFQ